MSSKSSTFPSIHFSSHSKSLRCGMHSVELVVSRSLGSIFWCLGLKGLPPSCQLRRLLLALAVHSLWLGYFLYMLLHTISFFSRDGLNSISYTIGRLLHMANTLVGMAIQAESVLKHRSSVRLKHLSIQWRLNMQRLGRPRSSRRAVPVLLLLAAQLGCDLSKTWAQNHYYISPVHFISLPQRWYIRLRYVQLVWQLMELNHRGLQLRHCVLDLASGNDVWPYGLPDWKRLQTLRLCYDCLHRCYESFSDCYGWGMLWLQLVCGFELVANVYWIITETYASQRIFIFIYNGHTCLSLSMLILALFYYGDASESNVQLPSASVMAWHIFHLIFCCLGVQWSSRRLHRLQFVPFVLWICWYSLVWPSMAKYLAIFRHTTIDHLLACSMFAMQTSVHALVLADTFFKRRTMQQLEQDLPVGASRSRGLICLGIVFVLVQCLSICSRLTHRWMWYSPLYWVCTPSSWCSQLKLLAFIAEILTLNGRVLSMRNRLKQMVVGQPLDEEHLARFMLQFRQLHEIFVRVNVVYGFSLLVIFILAFFDILFNAFWVVKLLMVGDRQLFYVLHFVGILVNLCVLLSASCWLCQQSSNHSRQIGCLIPRLARPLASKRYNDLVSEFMLQALHQRFVVTAKDFFSLNLQLLSNMIGAVVTYLVILIQFMLAEKTAPSGPG